MKNRWVLFSCLLLMAVPTLAFANHDHCGGGQDYSLEDKYFGKVHFLFKNKAELGLTEEQMEQIKTIKFDVKRAPIDANAKKDLAMLDIYQELHKDQPDIQKTESLIDQKYATKANLAKTLVNSMINTKAVLTADQQVKAKEFYWKS